MALQRVVDDHLVVYFLPPEDNESLAGSLAPYMDEEVKESLAGKDWQEIREAAWEAAARDWADRASEARKFIGDGGSEMTYTVGPKGEIVIAKELRERLGIEPGWMALQCVLPAARAPGVPQGRLCAVHHEEHLGRRMAGGARTRVASGCDRGRGALPQGMSGLLDTNVVIRYLTYDPPHQAEKATAIIEEEEDLYVTDGVIAEVADVLRQEYGLQREAVVDQLIRFLRLENLAILGFDKQVVLRALLLCRPSGRVSVADALTWAAALGTDHRVVYTLDERFPSNGITIRRERPLWCT